MNRFEDPERNFGPGRLPPEEEVAPTDQLGGTSSDITGTPVEAPVGGKMPDGSDEQQSGQQRLDTQDQETENTPTPGAPRPQRPRPQPNTPLGIAGTLAQVGSAGAAAFRSPEFFTNRVIGGGQPLRFGAGSGSSLGGAFSGTPGVQAPGAGRRRPGMSDEDLLMAIQASTGRGMFGG
jgi:hypothetical protein